MPLASTGIQFVSMFIAQKQNNSVVTNEKGLQDEEMAKKSQQNQSTQTMLYMMPLMTLWIGFTVPGALSIYWLIQGVASTVQDVILTKHFRKVYDEEDSVRQARAAEEEKLLISSMAAEVLFTGGVMEMKREQALTTLVGLYRYAAENGYEVAGFHREVYIDGIWNKENMEDWLTEIQLPIK